MPEQKPVAGLAIQVMSDHVALIVDAGGEDKPRRTGGVDQREHALAEEKTVPSVGVLADANDVATLVDVSCRGSGRLGAVDGGVGLRHGGGRA